MDIRSRSPITSIGQPDTFDLCGQHACSFRPRLSLIENWRRTFDAPQQPLIERRQFDSAVGLRWSAQARSPGGTMRRMACSQVIWSNVGLRKANRGVVRHAMVPIDGPSLYFERSGTSAAGTTYIATLQQRGVNGGTPNGGH